MNAHAVTGLAEPSPELMIQQPITSVEVDDFVFIDDAEDGGVSAGVVIDVDDSLGTATIHRCLPAAKQKLRYAKVHIDKNGQQVRKNRAPPGTVPPPPPLPPAWPLPSVPLPLVPPPPPLLLAALRRRLHFPLCPACRAR